MAKKGTADGVYRVTEVIGTSTTSWEDAAKNAVTTASKTLRDLRIAEVSAGYEGRRRQGDRLPGPRPAFVQIRRLMK